MTLRAGRRKRHGRRADRARRRGLRARGLRAAPGHDVIISHPISFSHHLISSHHHLISSGSAPLQARCVGLARLGCVVFMYDMLGRADGADVLSDGLAHGFGSVDGYTAADRAAMATDDRWGLYSAQAEHHLISMVRARPGRLSALSVFRRKLVLHGAFIYWLLYNGRTRVLNGAKRRIPARADGALHLELRPLAGLAQRAGGRRPGADRLHRRAGTTAGGVIRNVQMPPIASSFSAESRVLIVLGGVCLADTARAQARRAAGPRPSSSRRSTSASRRRSPA